MNHCFFATRTRCRTLRICGVHEGSLRTRASCAAAYLSRRLLGDGELRRLEQERAPSTASCAELESRRTEAQSHKAYSKKARTFHKFPISATNLPAGDHRHLGNLRRDALCFASQFVGIGCIRRSQPPAKLPAALSSAVTAPRNLMA